MYLSILLWILVSAQASNGIPSEQMRSAASTPLLTVCQVLSNAGTFDGKIVQIRGRVVSTDEGSSFVDDDCEGTFKIGGKIWPSAIAWAMPSAYCRAHSCVPDILHPVNFAYNWASDKRIKTEYKALRNRLPGKCIEFTYTGMFEVWSKEGARRRYKDGWIVRSGFGHLNSAGAQLVLKSADSVSAIPGCE